MSFKECLALGQKYEVIASEKIKVLNNVNIVSFNNDNKYDFVDDKDIKYEVKYDRMSNKTGNFFVEYECNRNPSGINTSESHFYIFMIDEEEGYMIETTLLKTFIEDELYTKKVSFTLDNRNMKGYIFNKFSIIEKATKI